MIIEDNNNREDKCIAAATVSLSEVSDKVDCLQRAVAMICGQQSDFKAEYREDIAEVKRQLNELRRNKVWISRESV